MYRMRRSIQSITRFLAVLLVVSWMPICVWAQADSGIADGWESYQERPDILQIEARESNTHETWNELRAGHLSFLAELLELYPRHEIYFLARDAEYLYDFGRLVTAGTAEANRIHLINVSRMSMRHADISQYLSEQGISADALRSGKQILLVDTGFEGTIPARIQTLLPPDLRGNIKTHLVVSEDGRRHPSSRVFQSRLASNAEEFRVSYSQEIIVQYEHLPHYTNTCRGYSRVNGRLQPVSRIQDARRDGVRGREETLSLMRDVRYTWSKPEVQQQFARERRAFRDLISVIDNLSKTEAIARIKRNLERLSPESRRYYSEMIRDVLEAKQTNFKTHLDYYLRDFGIEHEHGDLISERRFLTEQERRVENERQIFSNTHPGMSDFFRDPQHIQSAVQNQNWEAIDRLLLPSSDQGTRQLAIRAVFAPTINQQMVSRQLDYVNSLSSLDLSENMSSLFPVDRPIRRDILESLIDRGDQVVLEGIARVIFRNSFVDQIEDLLLKIIERGNSSVLSLLVNDAKDNPHTPRMRRVIELFITKGNDYVRGRLAAVFDDPQTEPLKDQLRRLVHLLNDEAGISSIVRFVLSQPHNAGHEDVAIDLIRKANPTTLEFMARWTFDIPHVFAMTEALRVFMTVAHPKAIKMLRDGPFARRTGLSGRHLILQQAIAMSPARRAAFLEANWNGTPPTGAGSPRRSGRVIVRSCEGLFAYGSP